MTMTDPIADMLTRIRNANTAHFDTVNMPGSKLKESLAAILVDEGYIVGYRVAEDPGKPGKTLQITMKYSPDRDADHLGDQAGVQARACASTPAPTSCPGCSGGMGVAVVSTAKGLMTDREARKRRMGGEVLCYVW